MVSELDKNSLPNSLASSSKGTPISLKPVLSVKLNNENHLLWKRHVLATVRGHNLLQFLKGAPKTVKNQSSQDETARNINTEYLE